MYNYSYKIFLVKNIFLIRDKNRDNQNIEIIINF